MALENDIKGAKEELRELNDALVGIEANFNSAINAQNGMNKAARRVANTYKNDLTKATDIFKESNLKILELQKKQNNGTKLNAKDQQELSRLEARRSQARSISENAINNLRREGVDLGAEDVINYLGAIDASEDLANKGKELVKNDIIRRGLTGNILDTFKEYLIALDKSGLTSAILNEELTTTQKLTLAGEAAMIAFAKGALKSSDNIAKLQRELGVSYEGAFELRNELASAAFESEKLFITSEDLAIAFGKLSQQTGLLADFGGETLVTFSTLTDQLGLSAEEAGKLTLLSRIQGKNTEDILSNTVDTVSSLINQNGVAINVKGVLSDVANVSDAIAVSLGKNPVLIAEAATEARLFGSNLEQVDKIAGSLLNFESSIAAELQAEVLTGRELNLEKARLLALNNDLAGLSKELADNAAITEAFATGNRIQQEAAAAALGISRDELAKIALQQDYNNMSAEQFKSTYGDVTYESLQAQSASEKFASALEKIEGIIGDISIVFAPILDGFARLITYIAESKAGLTILATIMGSLAALSVAKAIAETISSFAQSKIPFAALAGIAAAGGIIGMIASAKSQVQSVNDGIAPPGNGPFTITDAYGATAITAKGDGLAVSPNINSGGGSQERTNMLLEKLLAKDTNINMDGRRLNDSMKSSAISYNVGT
jgi:hypothetical protein